MYNKLISWLNQNVDKIYHFLAGMMICLISYIFLPMWIAVLIVVVAGLLKEVRDKRSYGMFDWFDLAATILGGLFVFFCLILKLWIQ